MPKRFAVESLVAGLATSIGSLPHTDADAAAHAVLTQHPDLPAAPQLPERTPLEGLIAQWARALPEVQVEPDGTLTVDSVPDLRDPLATFDAEAHGGLLTFLDHAALVSPSLRRVKMQLVGPLTLGVALHRAGMPARRAFERAAEATRVWVGAIEDLFADRLGEAALVLFFDEPSLVLWTDDDAPLEREDAIDILSNVLAVPECLTGVHVCGSGNRRMAFEAGPQILALDVRPDMVADADILARHLDADGWIAWGAVPTDRPVGELVDPLWRALAEVWCELTKRGSDPLQLRMQALVTPDCGLAGHGITQAERALRLARELAQRVERQVAAARLTVGA